MIDNLDRYHEIEISYDSTGGQILHDNIQQRDRHLIAGVNDELELYISTNNGFCLDRDRSYVEKKSSQGPNNKASSAIYYGAYFHNVNPATRILYDAKMTFIMPDDDVVVHLNFRKDEEYSMKTNDMKISNNESRQEIVKRFELPEEIATELDALLTKQSIRERLLLQVLDDPTKFEALENMLVPISARIEAIKAKITSELVPPAYRSQEYIWSYDGIGIDGYMAKIIHAG